jgi:signal transduction histidine kinase
MKDMLDRHQIENGTLVPNFQFHSLLQIVRDVVELIKLQADAKGLNVIIESEGGLESGQKLRLD